jgi:FKBP-type peptidyl-prolyl cis-trans isomerase
MDKNTLITTIVIMVLVVSGVIYLLWTNTNTVKNDQTNTSSSSVSSASELKIETLVEGKGEALKAGQNAVVNYRGTLTNGTEFDSSYKRNQTFTVNNVGKANVIEGWNQGLIGMKVGEKRRLTIPPALGYGSSGQGSIPGNATLIFEVELMEIK